MKNNRLLIYVHYNKNNQLADHVVYQIKKLQPIFSRIIFISNSILSEKHTKKICKYADIFVQRENKGYDFGAWSDGLKSVGYENIESYDSVTMMNDTCFGPLYGLSDIYKKMTQKAVDFWGLTDHAYTNSGMPGTDGPIPKHIQSYFLVFNNNVVKSSEFKKFWSSVKNHKDVFKVIQYYETKLTGLLESAGFRSGVFLETNNHSKNNNIDTPNYSEMQPLIVIEEGVPFVKIKSFLWTPHSQIIKSIKINSNYPVRLIKRHTRNMGIHVPIKRNVRIHIVDIVSKNATLYTCLKGLRDYINKVRGKFSEKS